MTKFVADERWDYVGSTVVSNNYVRLTPDHQSRKGAIWNNVVFYLVLINNMKWYYNSKGKFVSHL